MNKTTHQNVTLQALTTNHGHGLALLRDSVPTSNVTNKATQPPSATAVTWYLPKGPPYIQLIANTNATKITELAISARLYALVTVMPLDAA